MTENALTPAPPQPAKLSYATVEMTSTGGSGGALLPKSFGDVVAFASVMARADIALPKHLRGNDGACLAVAMQALRWEMDPFAVANKSYSVNDRLAYEAQLIAAVVHMRAPIARRPDYEYLGSGTTRQCRVSCEMLDGTTKEYVSPQIGQITTKNSPLWKSDPDQQLGYFAIRSWARRHTPEVILGVYAPEEVREFHEARNVSPGAGLRARLEARSADAREGFTATQAEESGHDPATGEIIDDKAPDEATDAVFEESGTSEPEADNAAPDEDFPGDRKPLPAGMKTGAELLAEQTQGPTLEHRLETFKAAVTGAKTSLAIKAAWPKCAPLRSALDAADPDLVPMTSHELEQWWLAQLEAKQAEEKAAAEAVRK